MLATTEQVVPAQMRAVVYTTNGSPDVLKLRALAVPVPKEHQVLVKVRAASVNPLDWALMRGEPAFLKMMGPKGKDKIPGVDVSGQVEKVGAKVTQFRRGDHVFGSAWGACAEYVCSKEASLAPKPAALTHEQAAAIPVAGKTALQALRDHGRLQRGQRVLINGAAGGVGTFAVQIARALGAEVTGVCSTRNVDLVRSLGAHHVIDHTVEDFVTMGRQYDVVVQLAGNQKNDELRRALAPRGTLVLVGGGTGREGKADISMLDVLGSFAGNLLAPFMRQKTRMMMTKSGKGDLFVLTQMIEAGTLTPVIDRTYPLTETAEAIRYLETGHARGKVVVTV